jgi:uncharacterized FAD-dependent dehydrogenase
MQKNIPLRLLPSQAADYDTVKHHLAQTAGNNITGFYIIKQSIDARGKQPWVNLVAQTFIDEPFVKRAVNSITFQDVSHAKKTAIIVGAGPAGLFAALKLIELGIKPVVLERGKDVRARRRDLAVLNKEGIINEESNYCFGEGGAGTYSDGKLYTRSNKRGDVTRILNLFVQFGADEKILYDSHPHIGTNKLPNIIVAMREQIVGCGGQIFFEKKVTGLVAENDVLKGIKTADGDTIESDAVILATGHSARDIFELLHYSGILIEAKPFALGVRIEHPQALIDSIQYHCPIATNNTFLIRDEHLPPASYSLVEQVNNRGVFSFCMCPGGIIAPAATAKEELVVNGWSPSKRNNPYANSGMVVSVEESDLKSLTKLNKDNNTANSPLALMQFQSWVEKKAYAAGGGKFVAPAQRMVDFCNNKTSTNLPICSYVPGLNSTSLAEVLPPFIYNALQSGFKAFGNKMHGYYTNEAVVVATESRTSSPVRMPRNADTLEHPQIKNLYPCGEGAGYAGGIISAAMDGEKIAQVIADRFGMVQQ